MKISMAPIVSAFSQAGGLGCLASAGMQIDDLRQQIRQVRQQTDAPFAVNIAWTVPNSIEIFQVLLEEEIGFIISSAGNPEKNLEQLKSVGVKVFQVVADVSQAKRAEAQGLDAVITKGYESGGLNSLEAVATLPLVPMVVDAISIPVIAAGGIGDGRSMAAAMALGAEGVLMGTRFLTSDESPVHIDIKKALLNAKDTDTVSVSFKNFSARFWKNKKSSSIIGHEPLWDLATDLNQEIDADSQLVGAGQIVGLDTAVMPVAEIIQQVNTTGKTSGIDFSSGGSMSLLNEKHKPDVFLQDMKRVTNLVITMRGLPQPIISKVRGVAYVVGVNIALNGDFVLASHDAQFCQVFINLGAILDGGGTFLLPRLVGMVKARELAMLGDVVKGREAESLGLIYKSTADEDLDLAVESLAIELAKKPCLAMSLIKEGLNKSFDMSLNEAMNWEAVHQTVALQSPEHKKRVKAFLAKGHKKRN